MKTTCRYIYALLFVFGFSFNAVAVPIVVWEQMEPNALKEFKKIVYTYNKQNPQDKVILKHYTTENLRTNYQMAALAGGGPDIVYGPDDMIGLFKIAQIISPVNNFFSQSFLEKFDTNALKSTEYQGSIYGLPDLNGNHIALVYNKDLVSNPPKTFKEFLEVSQRFQQESKSMKNNTYGILFNIKEPFWFIGFYNGFGGSVFNKQGQISLNNKAMVDALIFVRDLRQKYNLGFDGMDYNISHQLFMQGKSPFILQGSWAWAEYKKAGMNIGITYMPISEDKKALFYSSTKTFLFSNSKSSLEKKEAIVKFIEYIFADENYKPYVLSQGIIPTTVSLSNDKDVLSNDLVKDGKYALQFTAPMPNSPEMRAIWDAIRPHLEATVDGKMKPNDAAAAMQEDAEKLIKTMFG